MLNAFFLLWSDSSCERKKVYDTNNSIKDIFKHNKRAGRETEQPTSFADIFERHGT